MGAAVGGVRERWSPRLESNQYPTLRRHVHYPLCYGEDAQSERIIAQAAASVRDCEWGRGGFSAKRAANKLNI